MKVRFKGWHASRNAVYQRIWCRSDVLPEGKELFVSVMRHDFLHHRNRRGAADFLGQEAEDRRYAVWFNCRRILQADTLKALLAEWVTYRLEHPSFDEALTP